MLESATSLDFTAFVAFGRDRLSSDKSVESLEDLLREWRTESRPSNLSPEDMAASREAIDDYMNGDRGRPAEEVSAELARRLEALEG